MRSLLLALRRRMVVKVFLAVALVVSCALLGLAWWQTSHEIKVLKASTRDSAEQLARVLVGNIETAMLQGDGILVKQQVQRLKATLADAEIHIYDPNGTEVFAEPPPPPAMATLPAPLVATLADGKPRDEVDRDWRPIANDKRCHECHDPGPPLRGVLAVSPPRADAKQPAREDVIASLVTSGFIQIMTAKKEDELNNYFGELATKAQTVRSVGVYGRTGDVAFGVEVPGVTKEMIDAKLTAGSSRSRSPTPDGGTLELVPLPMEDRCEQCHERDDPVRGVLVVSLATSDAAAREMELSSVIDTSLRYIMLSSLGRMISKFLDEVIATGAVGQITLYDHVGRTYYTSTPPAPAPHISAVLTSRQPSAAFTGESMAERVRVVRPLANDAKCARCHGSDSALRGVVSVSLSTKIAAEARETAGKRATLFIIVALVFVLLVVYTLLHVLVVSPVQRIGAVADAVGHGQLDISIKRVHPEGDEVQRLGSRINDMIRGLRTEFHMRRFVSRGAAAAARVVAQASTPSGVAAAATVGERLVATVLFTDIRGFTAYSETVPPEKVVEMLNRFLQVQADIVERHGGDIDKYVGDELMAVFHGEDAAARAVRAGVEMVAAVESVRAADETLAVGCGVSTGEVIYGPIGSAERKDFTVIGDVVNTGARLCSAAQGGEVIVSTAVREACGELFDVELTPMEPLNLKGKRQPFAVFRATARATTATRDV